MSNYKVVAIDAKYPEKGGIAALVGIYPTLEGANFIKKVVEKRYPQSVYTITSTNLPCTIKYKDNFTIKNLELYK